MRAGEEFSEMAELGSTYVGGGAGAGGSGRWGSSYGGATWGRTPHHVPRGGAGTYPAAQQHAGGGSYEAEDAAGVPPPRGGGSRSGLYYSPPGTSYTIVERPSSGAAHHHTPRADYVREGYSAKMAPRGTYLGSNSSYTAGRNTPSNNKKRPISPEQVLRMFGSSQHNSTTKLNMDRPRRSPASSPASTTHQVNYRSRSPGGGVGAVPSTASGATSGGGGGYSLHELATRTVTMVRDPPDGTHGFGICVKGGKNSGVGVYISRVEEGSVAERAGLRPGDSILEVNGTPFTGISHEEALKMLKSCRKLSMTVRSPTLPGGGVMYTGGSGGPWLMRQTCSWMDRQGRPVSPPLEYARPGVPPPQQSSGGRYGYPRSASKDRSIRRVDLCIEPGQSLGLMIRGGVEYNLGIFITGVDKDSVADRAGLMVGDQILEVNGQSFLDVTHDEAVSQLKYHKRMSLLVRDVGKVPHSCTAYDRDVPWDQLGSPGSRVSNSRKWSAALQMVEEKARSLLARSEFASLCYYTDEYAARHMGIEAYVQVVLELLNTPEKYTLLTELREIIAPEDRVRFDELVYRPDPLRSSNRDPREHDYRHSRRKPGMQLDSNHTMLMSSLHEISAPELAHKLSRSFDMKDEQSLLDASEAGGIRRHQSMQRLARDPGGSGSGSDRPEGPNVVSDLQGNLRVIVRKSKPILGIAIEGGANTKHPLPRIINIHENGAAYSAGGLEVGQLILQVDGQRVEGLQHQEVARLIAESFARPDREDIEFLVVEAKKSNLEPKPTALIFLEA